LRILLLFDAIDTLGGVENRNRQLAAELVRQGHRVTLGGIPTGGRATEPPPGVDRLALGTRRPGLYDDAGHRRASDALIFARHAGNIDLSHYDVIETASLPYVHLFPLARRARRAGVLFAVTWYEFWAGYWQGYVGRLKAPIFEFVERLATRRGERIAASCELTRQRLARFRPEVSRVPCGIDLEAVQRAAQAPSTELPAGPLAFAGRLLEAKRVDLLLEAVAILAPTRPEPELLTVFGEGPERGRLEAKARELGVAGRVSFRGRVPADHDLWAALAHSQVAVQPSEREGFGLFPLEAMALGLPVVYCESSESAVGEVVRSGIEGESTAAHSAALAAALGRLLENPAALRRLSENARRRAADYSWEKVSALFLDWIAPGRRAT
jgi:glycosyltransferase involved in cell wall biosynthesis